MNDLSMESGYAAVFGAALFGVTLLLAMALTGGVRSRQPIDRQRAAELGVLAALLWLPLAFVPLPKFLLVEDSRAPVAVSPTESVATQSADPIGLLADAVMPSPRDKPDSTHPAHAEWAESASADAAPEERAIAALPPAESQAFGDVREISSEASELLTSWFEPLLAVFGIGSLISVAWLLAGAWQLRRILQTAHIAPAGVVEALPTSVHRRTRVLVTDRGCRPFCCGLIEPRIVIPRSLCEDPALGDVLRHEAAHLRQGDPWSNLLFAVALPFLWFHPLFWWVRSRARMAAEVIADDQAAQTSSKTDYARRMIELAASDSLRAPAAAVPIFRRPSDFTRRIEMLLKRENPLAHRSSAMRRMLRWTSMSALFVVLLGSIGATTTAQERRRVKAERDALRAEVEALKVEIANLREQLELRSGQPQITTGALVKPGDTLRSVLEGAGIEPTPELIQRTRDLNPDCDPNRLRVNQVIRLPKALTKQRPPRPSLPELPDAVDVPDPVAPKPPRPTAVKAPAVPSVAAFPGWGHLSSDSALSLVDSIIEAEGRIEMTHAKFASADVNEGPVISAEARMYERKLGVLRRLAKSEMQTLLREMQMEERELDRSKGLIDRGFMARGSEHAAEARIMRLRTSIDLLSSVVTKRGAKKVLPRGSNDSGKRAPKRRGSSPPRDK